MLIILMSPVRFFKALCFTLGAIVLMVGTGILVYLISFFHSLPDMDTLPFHKIQTLAQKRVYEKIENKQIKHRWTPLKDVSRDCLYAIVASEDGTFFEHSGINVDAMVMSLAVDFKKREAAYGASTITQQVVKNLFLNSGKTLSRKARELLITSSLEKHLTKNQILEIYLNIAEFGPDLFGIQAASEHFFRQPPSQINAAQAAFLALMLPSPKRFYYAIYQNRNLTRLRRKKIERVLRDMLYSEFISEVQYRRYLHYNYFSPQRVPARAK